MTSYGTALKISMKLKMALFEMILFRYLKSRTLLIVLVCRVAYAEFLVNLFSLGHLLVGTFTCQKVPVELNDAALVKSLDWFLVRVSTLVLIAQLVQNIDLICLALFLRYLANSLNNRSQLQRLDTGWQFKECINQVVVALSLFTVLPDHCELVLC